MATGSMPEAQRRRPAARDDRAFWGTCCGESPIPAPRNPRRHAQGAHAVEQTAGGARQVVTHSRRYGRLVAGQRTWISWPPTTHRKAG